MKILKIILILAGSALILLGLYNAFVPQEFFDIETGSSSVTLIEGFNSQTIGMIGLGVVALIAGAFLKNRK